MHAEERPCRPMRSNTRTRRFVAAMLRTHSAVSSGEWSSTKIASHSVPASVVSKAAMTAATFSLSLKVGITIASSNGDDREPPSGEPGSARVAVPTGRFMETGRTISVILIRRCHHLAQIFKTIRITHRFPDMSRQCACGLDSISGQFHMRKLASTRWCQDGPWIPSPLNRKRQNCGYHVLLPSTLSQALCFSISRAGDFTNLCDDFGSTIARSTHRPVGVPIHQRWSTAMLPWHIVVRSGCSGGKQDRTSLPDQHRADDYYGSDDDPECAGIRSKRLESAADFESGPEAATNRELQPPSDWACGRNFCLYQRRFQRDPSSLRPRQGSGSSQSGSSHS